jgi:tripartite-type tricarboxylate transporter receptor subunit TctC
VDLAFPTITAALPLFSAGKVRILAVTSRTRSALKPEIPTLDESGLPGYDRSSWNGLVAPSAVNKEIITQLHGATVKAVNSAEMKSALQKLGLEPVSSTPEQFASFVRSEIAENAKLLQAIGEIKN